MIASLIKRYIDGCITDEEMIILRRWRQQAPENEELFVGLTDGDEILEDALLWIEKDGDDDSWLQRVKVQTLERTGKVSNSNFWQNRAFLFYSSVVAAVLLLVGVFTFQLFDFTADHIEDISAASVLAGSNKATLTLSNGEKIDLRCDKEGVIMDEQLIYSDGTPLLSIDKQEKETIEATIQVPRGGKYKVTLPDGSKVHLNAQSTLSYPLTFRKECREVSLEGEAYFEVAKLPVDGNHERMPFEVICSGQKIVVTGTSFNVSAYADDMHTITTLVEGAVHIELGKQVVHLKPDYQVITANGRLLKTQEIDVTGVIAWKDNKFLFYETELRDLMKSLSRWYGVDVSYEGNIVPTYLYGEISRSKNLDEVLRIMDKSGVRFKLQKKGEALNLIVLES